MYINYSHAVLMFLISGLIASARISADNILVYPGTNGNWYISLTAWVIKFPIFQMPGIKAEECLFRMWQSKKRLACSGRQFGQYSGGN